MNKFIDSNDIIFTFTNSSQKHRCRKILIEENITMTSILISLK